MPSLLVLEIYFLLLLSGDGKGAGWIRLLHGGSVEDEGDTDVNNFIDLTTWRFGFPGGDIKVEMMPPSWNNFLRSLLRFVVVRSDHNEGLGRIYRSVFLFLWWQKEEDGRHKKEEVSPLRLQECLATICWASVLEFVAGCLPVHVECLPVQPFIRSVI